MSDDTKTKEEPLDQLAGMRQRIAELEQSLAALEQRQDRFRESDTNLRLLAKTIEDVFWISTPDITKMIYVSPAYEKLWGRSIDGLYDSPLSFMEAIHPEDRERVAAAVAEHSAGYWDLEYRIVQPDGTIRWVLDRGFPVRDETGVLALMTGVARDITDRKTAEEALKKGHDELEQKVLERTAELETTNEQLLREIAERQAAQEALREREELLTAVLDALPDVVGVQLPDHTVTRYNRAGYGLLGLAPEQVHGRKCYELIGRSDPCTPCASSLAVKSMRPESLEKYVPELGRYFWCTATPIPGPSGEAKLVVERLLDITDRKKTEEALERSQAELSAIFNSISDAIVFAGTDRKIVRVNPAFTSMWGYEPEEAIGMTTEFLYANRSEFEEQGRKRYHVAAGPAPALFETNYRRKIGTVFPAESLGTQVKDSAGNVIGFLGVHRDIADRKQAEEALRKSEEFNRRLVDLAPFGIAYLAADGTIEYVNPASGRMAGIPEGRSSTVVGRNILELRGIQARSEVREGFRRLLAGESLSDLEIPYTSSTGRDTVLLVAATPRFGSDGKVAGAVIMFTDISDRKRAEELQRQTVRYKAVADLAEGVAHNFNNLLQIVIGHLELALVDLEAGEYAAVKDGLEKVLKSSKLGAEVVRRLQRFGRRPDSLRVSQKAVFDLSDIAGQALEVSQAWLTAGEKEGRKVSLHTRIKKGCFVNADKNEMFEVVVNLLRNAVEALPTGGDVDLTTAVRGDEVILQVKDTGIGIAQENLGRIFNPFFTTKAEAGAGLSLAAGRRIIEDCGGRITVESVEGQGTTFKVLLPLAEQIPEPTRVLPEPETEQPLTILVIDDMEVITDLMKSALTAYGHAVLTALSGEEGIEIFKENTPDVVICDLGMPGMNGWKVGNRIKAMCLERGVCKTPFVLVTAWADQNMETEKIAWSGVDAVIGKPLNIKKMLELVREVVEKRLPTGAD